MRSLQAIWLVAALLLVGSFGAAACGGDDDEGAEPPAEATTAPSGTTEETTTEATTTEEGPPPITASEERWVREMNEVRREMTRGFHQTRVYTASTMARLAKTYSTCLRSLDRAGDPGRFQPAARVAERACKQFEQAGSMMERALAIEDAGIYSQADADRYNKFVERGIEGQGNAVNTFIQASTKARTIQEELSG